jgi:hypothetical protein
LVFVTSYNFCWLFKYLQIFNFSLHGLFIWRECIDLTLRNSQHVLYIVQCTCSFWSYYRVRVSVRVSRLGLYQRFNSAFTHVQCAYVLYYPVQYISSGEKIMRNFRKVKSWSVKRFRGRGFHNAHEVDFTSSVVAQCVEIIEISVASRILPWTVVFTILIIIIIRRPIISLICNMHIVNALLKRCHA